MPRIRLPYEPTEQARQGIPSPQANPDAFSAVGRATEQLGGSMQALGVRMGEYQEKKDKLAATSTAAQMAADWEVRYIDLMKKQPPGSPDFTSIVREDYDRFIEERSGQMSGSQARLLRPMIDTARANNVIRAARHEAESSAADGRLRAQQGLAATVNRVASNPTAYDEATVHGNTIIDSMTGLTGDQRAEFRRSHQNDLTRAVFESRIYSSQTPEALDTVLADLARPEWQERAGVANYDQLLDKARTFRSTLAHGRDTRARTAIDFVEDRMNAGTVIDPAEIAATEQTVRASQDPGVLWKWAKLRAGYDAQRTGVRASPAALTSAINNNRNQSGMPPELSSAIDEASRSTGGQVSSSFLSQLASRQGGDYLRSQQGGNRRFALQPTHGGVDVGNVRQDVREAGEIAGELFGQPLRINSGYRSQERQNQIVGDQRLAGRSMTAVAGRSHHTSGDALDIDTTGMDNPTRGRLVDSLVRAGFTRFGEYGTHIHADMGANVPSAYDPAKSWGGWTPLSPDVMQVLERRGFRAGRSGAEIDRSGPGGERPNRPAPPENGVFNFDENTWVDLVARNPEAAGVTISDMTTRADLLRLRQDPKTAATMAAVYARQNRLELQAGLGRDVSDPELYMAHVMGPANALVLLRAFREAPNLPIDDVLPNVGQRHPELFQGNRDGSPATVGDVYTGFMSQFSAGVSALQHVRTERLRQVQERQNAVRRDPHGDIMTHASRAGNIALTELNTEGDFTTRGRQALEMQRFYDLPDPRPLTGSEVEKFGNVIKNGTVADVQGLITQLQSFGPQAAQGAYRQLGSQDEVFGHVAGLATTGEANAGIAREIIRGRARIRDNPDAKQIFTTAPGGTDNQFNLAVGTALDSADPKARQAIRQAADALYIERYAGDQTVFDPKLYVNAVQAVLGGTDTAGGVATVNGAKVVLPMGVQAADFDRALDGLAPADLTTLSVDGRAPRYRDGRVATPLDIATEGRFRLIGADAYTIVMADGLPLWSASGKPYQITMSPETVRELVKRAPPLTVQPDADFMTSGTGTR